MSERASNLQRVRLGKEATPGAADTNCTVELSGFDIEIDTEQSVKEIRTQGSKYPRRFILNREWGSGALSGTPYYDEIGWALASVLSAPISTTVANATATEPAVGRHEFISHPRAADNPYTYRIERGDDDRIKATTCAWFTDFELKFEEDATASGTLVCRKVDPDVVSTATPYTAAWLLTLGTASTFQIEIEGATTPALDADSNAAAIQTAIQALPTVGAGNLLVTGTGPFVISAAAALSAKRLPAPIATGSNDGTAPTVTIGEAGGMHESEVEPIIPTTIECVMSTTLDGLASGKLEDALVSGVKIANGRSPVWKQDGSGTFAGWVEGNASVDISLTIETGAESDAFVTAARSGDPVYFRLVATGDTIQGAYKRYLEILCACNVKEVGKHTDHSGVYARDFVLSSVDANDALPIVVTLQNTVAAY